MQRVITSVCLFVMIVASVSAAAVVEFRSEEEPT